MYRCNPWVDDTSDQPVIERVFQAPRELVWQAWTDPQHLLQWWVPEAAARPSCEIDLRVGGRLHFRVSTSEFGELWAGSVLYEIDPPSRLVFGDYLADAEGNRVSPGHYNLSPDFPEETVTSVSFEDLGDGRTKLTLR